MNIGKKESVKIEIQAETNVNKTNVYKILKSPIDMIAARLA